MYNEINLLVVEIDLLNTIEKYYINSLIHLTFENIDFSHIALERLQKFGVIKPVNESIGEELYIKYFHKNMHSNTCTNNILFLDSYLSKDIKYNIADNIKSLLGEEYITYIKKIGKVENRIYVV